MSHKHDSHAKERLEAIFAMINALDATASDEFQRGAVRAMRSLAEQDDHLLQENEHLKKAMDLLLEQIFKAQNS